MLIYMDEINDFKGLNGQLVAFKEEVKDANKITFIGAPGVCTPLASLFAYAVRDKESHYITLTDITTSRKFELISSGMQLNNNITSNPHGSDIVVLLGGLAMPKSKVDINKLNNLIKDILNLNGQIIGCSFMDIFAKMGWLDKIEFDIIIDATLLGKIKK